MSCSHYRHYSLYLCSCPGSFAACLVEKQRLDRGNKDASPRNNLASRTGLLLDSWCGHSPLVSQHGSIGLDALGDEQGSKVMLSAVAPFSCLHCVFEV